MFDNSSKQRYSWEIFRLRGFASLEMDGIINLTRFNKHYNFSTKQNVYFHKDEMNSGGWSIDSVVGIGKSKRVGNHMVKFRGHGSN